MMEEDDNTQPTMQSSPFDAIRRVDEQGREYWNARDLARLLGYRQYTNFTGAIHKAEIACKESGEAVPDHFLHTQEMIPGGKGAKRPYSTVHLSRFACYLLVENADPEGRPIVAIGQKYFAIQTRRQELADELTLSVLPEDQKRLIYRREMAILNHQLAEAANLSSTSASSAPLAVPGRPARMGVWFPLPAYPRLLSLAPSTSSNRRRSSGYRLARPQR